MSEIPSTNDQNPPSPHHKLLALLAALYLTFHLTPDQTETLTVLYPSVLFYFTGR
ncbi:hypothetical protein [Streptomyces sp. NPDC008150]|uniref:hypothetical protein n=1 Tax=Streptomyces sp. NPDC008150 TaxID=3364816 RepID=UPI0036EF0DB1